MKKSPGILISSSRKTDIMGLGRRCERNRETRPPDVEQPMPVTADRFDWKGPTWISALLSGRLSGWRPLLNHLSSSRTSRIRVDATFSLVGGMSIERRRQPGAPMQFNLYAIRGSA
jgi:hypothetical protein